MFHTCFRSALTAAASLATPSECLVKVRFAACRKRKKQNVRLTPCA